MGLNYMAVTGENNLLILDVAWSSTIYESEGYIIEMIQVLPGTWDHETNGVILAIWCHFNRSKHMTTIE